MAKESTGRQPTPEVEEILSEHLSWLRGGGGRQADFSNREDLQQTSFAGRDLRQAIFRKANLQGANLQGTNLQGASLQEANLRGANLREADLQGTDLQEADLSQTRLQNVDLTTANNLFLRNLAGADLTGAKVPKQIQDFLNKPGNLDEVARLTGSLFVTALSASAYIALTVMATTDAGLLTNSATSKLPILSIDIPIAWFYWLAPLLLLSMYMYFHLTLQRLWSGLADLPAIYPDGQRLDQMSYPWLLNALVGKYIPMLQDQGQQGRKRKTRMWVAWQVLTSIFFVWWVVPLMIAVLWFRYLTRHDWLWTIVQIAILWFAVWFGFKSWRVAKSTLQGQGGSFLAWWQRTFSGVTTCLLLIITVLIPIISYGVISGISPSEDTDESRISDKTRQIITDPDRWAISKAFSIYRDNCPKSHDNSRLSSSDPREEDCFIAETWSRMSTKLKRIIPLMLKDSFLHYNPFAELSSAEVSIKPAKWSGDVGREVTRDGREKDQARECVTPPSKEPAKDKKLFVPPPEEIAQVRGAPLHGLDLRYVRGKRAFLIKAELQNKKGIALNGANLQGAYLPDADLQFANLEHTILTRALLNNAHFFGATLQKANLQKAGAGEADFSEANLQEADLREAILREASFVKARLQGADFSGALIQGAKFQGALGLEKNQVENASLWKLAYYDQELLKDLNLPPDHNDRLRGQDLSGYDFRKANLERADFSGMNLKWARFQGANLSDANLTKADLRLANLKGAILHRAELRGANFKGAAGLYADRIKEGKTWVLAKYDSEQLADLNRSRRLEATLIFPDTHNDQVDKKDLRDHFVKSCLPDNHEKIDLAEADLSQINLEKAQFKGCNLRNANFDGANLKGANFNGANLREASLSGADVQGAIFGKGCEVTAAALKKARFWRLAYYEDIALIEELGLDSNHQENLQNNDLRLIPMSREDLSGLDLSEKMNQRGKPANLRRANLQGANFYKANLEGADLEGANLEGANLTWANLKGAKLEKVTGLKDVQGARNWFLAFYDTAFIKKNLQGIPGGDHNDRVINKDLSHYEFAGKYLFEGDFSGFTLFETGFQRTYLPRAKFSQAKLQGANLSHALLKGADFAEAELFGAVLDGANLRDANFRGALGLTKAQVLQAVNWALARYDDNLRKDLGLPAGHNKRLDGEKKDLSGPDYNFDNKQLCNQLNQSDFSEVNFAGAKFPRAALKKTDFSTANLERAELMEADCQKANLEGAILRGARLIKANFKEANLREVNLSGADLSKADLTGACLQGAKLYDAILEKTDLKGADLSKVQGFSPKQKNAAIIDATTKLP